jgi:GNAT superfamily N-acetyltransferase
MTQPSHGSGFTIRRATLDDVETLVSLRHVMQAEMEHGYEVATPDEIIEPMRKYFREQLAGYHFAAFIAEVEGRPIGTGGVVVFDVPPSPSNPEGAEGYVMNMYTVPEWRGRGVAHSLVDALVRHAYGEGARRMWLRTSEDGESVYQRFGFRKRDHYMQMWLHDYTP